MLTFQTKTIQGVNEQMQLVYAIENTTTAV